MLLAAHLFPIWSSALRYDFFNWLRTLALHLIELDWGLLWWTTPPNIMQKWGQSSGPPTSPGRIVITSKERHDEILCAYASKGYEKKFDKQGGQKATTCYPKNKKQSHSHLCASHHSTVPAPPIVINPLSASLRPTTDFKPP